MESLTHPLLGTLLHIEGEGRLLQEERPENVHSSRLKQLHVPSQIAVITARDQVEQLRVEAQTQIREHGVRVGWV